jgi:hypothetical protein
MKVRPFILIRKGSTLSICIFRIVSRESESRKNIIFGVKEFGLFSETFASLETENRVYYGL